MGITNLVSEPKQRFQFRGRKQKDMSSMLILVVVAAAALQVAECKSAQHGLRQAKANPDRDVEHMRCPSFNLFTEEEVNHDNAAEKCKEWGGQLASLNTVAKAQFVSGMLEEGQWAWIGGDCIDCQVVEDDKWMWLSGDRLDLQNPPWKVYGGEQTPYDNSGDDATHLMVYKKDGDVQIVNFAGTHSEPFLS